jgi:NADH dehydrogenase (ubiquinone) Fe-S protein 1
VNPEQRWNGYNVINRHSGILNALELGIDLQTVHAKPKVLLLLSDNNIESGDIPEDCYVIYIGSHGDSGAALADLVLPGCTFMEKNATFVNLEGRVQHANKVVSPPGFAKEDWKIIRALSEACGVRLPYDTL